jgi:AcrR family transcriptional regulator
VTPGTPAPRRRYTSSLRARQADQTRADVLTAAIALFSTGGWAGTTLADVAAEAGVAVETIYNGFGSKKGLLRAAMETAVVGDPEPVPLVEREVWRRLGEGPVAARWEAGTALLTDIHDRSAGVWRALVEAAAADREVESWRSELEARRRTDVGRAVERIVGSPPDDSALDLVWAVWGPEVYLKLVRERGMAPADYEAAMIRAAKAFLGPARRSAQ